MVWRVEFLETAKKQLRKIDRRWQKEILDFLEHDIAPLKNPRVRGKPLVGDKKGLWRYRVGDYRIICDIEDKTLLITAIMIGHRREVYD